MGSFSASLRTVGDANTLAATIELSDGRLRIAAGDTEIGDWALTEVHLEEIPTGYRMAVEGELLLLELSDTSSFSAELERSSKKKRRRISRKKETSRESTETEDQPAAPSENPVVPSAPAVEEEQELVATEVKAPSKPAEQKSGSKILDAVDGLLNRAKKKFGSYLPDWVFSRGMLVIVVALLALLAVFPGVSSMVLLAVGGLGVLFGAVVYSDTVLASRWLPGRATPQQALLTGLAVFLVGILLGVIAR